MHLLVDVWDLTLISGVIIDSSKHRSHDTLKFPLVRDQYVVDLLTAVGGLRNGGSSRGGGGVVVLGLVVLVEYVVLPVTSKSSSSSNGCSRSASRIVLSRGVCTMLFQLGS